MRQEDTILDTYVKMHPAIGKKGIWIDYQDVVHEISRNMDKDFIAKLILFLYHILDEQLLKFKEDSTYDELVDLINEKISELKASL